MAELSVLDLQNLSLQITRLCIPGTGSRSKEAFPGCGRFCDEE